MDTVEIARLVRGGVRRPTGMGTAIVAIDGFGGAGKSTLAAALAPFLGAQVVHTDDFASWDEPLEWWPRLRDQVLVPLYSDAPGRFQRFDWDEGRLAEWHDVSPAEFLLVEGVSASRAEFREFLSFAIWVEAGGDLRLRRGLERDGEDARPLWEAWGREEAAWAERDRPRARADLVVAGDG